MPLPSSGILLRGVALAGCAALLAACGASPRSSAAPPRLALVIGNGAYENAPPLRNPVNDAADMCAKLGKLGFRTLCHTNLRDRAEFDARVKEYVDQLGPNSVGVFYYSGHGVQVGEANFMIPTQVQPKTVGEDPLRVLYGLDDLFDRLQQKPTRLQLVILDACRTDLFAQPPRPAGGRGPTTTATRSELIRSLETKPRVGNGLAPIKHAPPDTLVLYATGSKEAAYDGEGRNGPLTKHILRHVDTYGVKVKDFLDVVATGVKTETERDYRNRQTPFTYGSFSGEFCFAGCGIGVPPIY